MDNDPNQPRYHAKTEAFGRWLLAQKDRGDWIDDLAAAARSDRTFPKDGDPEAARKHLRAQQADGDTFQAIDDAETEWQANT
ncbi:YozE family protein [Sphingomonas sp. PB4P5]|uniref:YozE family protein n=1 Tax=Parasphingomonas puruogangriensis TaxID=3096155 RepID=UPI002FC67412